MKTTLILLAGLLAGVVSLSAQTQILITLNGTTQPTSPFDPGAPVSFGFLLSDYGSGQAEGVVSGGDLTWNDDGSPSTRLIDNFTGGGITGAWTAPVDPAGQDFNTFMQFQTGSNGLQIGMAAVGGAESGLYFDGHLIHTVDFQFTSDEFGFGEPAAGQTPAQYLLAYVGGTYAANEGGSTFGLSADVLGDVSFNITSVTLSTVSAVPEPSTYAAILGALALTATICLRRRRSAQAQA